MLGSSPSSRPTCAASGRWGDCRSEGARRLQGAQAEDRPGRGPPAARERRAQSNCHRPAARDRAVVGLQVSARDRSGRLTTKHKGLAWREASYHPAICGSTLSPRALERLPLAHPSPRVRALISAAVIRAGQLRLRICQIRYHAKLSTLSADPSAAVCRAGSGSRRAAGSGGWRACRRRWRRSSSRRDRVRRGPSRVRPRRRWASR